MITRFLVAFLVAAVLTLLIAACGDDDDDDDSAMAYLQGIDTVIVRADERFETEVFEGLSSAREGLEGVADVFRDAAADFDDLEPPEDLGDLHEKLVEDTNANAEVVSQVAAETPDDLPPDELGVLFEEEPLATSLADTEDEPLCQLKTIAVERGIEVGDLGCDLFGDEDDEDEDEEGDDDGDEGA